MLTSSNKKKNKTKGDSWFNRRFQAWVARNIPPTDKITLHRSNIFIVPSRQGMMFVLAAALIFVAAINYAISLAFGLAFLMVSIFILTILYSFNNINQLTVKNLPSMPVFCGEDAMFQVLLLRFPKRRHEALELNFPQANVTRTDLVELDQDTVTVFVPTVKRGEFTAPRLRITTYFPLGLCRAWSIIDMNLKCLVYPKPVPVAMNQIFNRASNSGDTAFTRDGSEDFYGLRNYVVGDSMHQVAWKAVARGQGMQVKQFVEYVDDRVWLDWDMFYGFNTEERLSRLCYCVLKLSKTSTAYGLKLPGMELAPDKGVRHRNRILEILALYRSPETRTSETRTSVRSTDGH